MSAPTYTIRIYQGDRCWGSEYDQTPEQIARLVELWGPIAKDDERMVITPTAQRLTPQLHERDEARLSGRSS